MSDAQAPAPKAQAPAPRTPPMKIMSLSMARTGTTTMEEAFKILGCKKVFSGWTAHREIDRTRMLIKAVGAKYHEQGPPIKDSDIYKIFDGYDAIAGDVPAMVVAEELIRAYPDTKILLVERDVEAWYASFESEVLAMCFQPLNPILGFLDPQLLGPIEKLWSRGILGVFQSRSRSECGLKAKEIYKEYYAHLRKAVPHERLLDFKLGDGWVPLCKFLDVEVPDCPFPRLNERGENLKATKDLQRRSALNIGKNVAMILSLAAGIWWGRSNISDVHRVARIVEI